MADDNKGFFGLSNAHIAFRKSDGTWEPPIPIKYAMELKLDPDGSSEKRHADNGTIYEARINNGFTGTAKFADIEDALLVKMLNQRLDDNGGVVGLTEVQPAEFALLSEEQGTANPRRSCWYSCTVGRPSRGAQTNSDTPSWSDVELPITAIPIVLNDEKLDHYTLRRSEENKTVYDAFFDAVPEPDQAAA